MSGDQTVEPDWTELSRRAAFASHRLVGWIFWDPGAIAEYAALGVPDGRGYYIATRAAPLAPAGDGAVTAAFGSIHAGFISLALAECRNHTTWAEAADARHGAVRSGLQQYAPEILDGLAELAEPLWAAADSLPSTGRVLFAALRDQPRPSEPSIAGWAAVDCIREWRGDTHWAIQVAEGLDHVESGVLDGAWRAYEDGWLPKSRGADDDSIAEALASLERRGLAEPGDDGLLHVNRAGIEYRQTLEDRLDRIAELPWRLAGLDVTMRFLDLVEPVGDRLLDRIDATAGPNWMPAARTSRATLS